MKAPTTAKNEMYIRQASPSSYRQVLREIRQREIFKMIVDTNPRNIQTFFRAVSVEGIKAVLQKFLCGVSLLKLTSDMVNRLTIS